MYLSVIVIQYKHKTRGPTNLVVLVYHGQPATAFCTFSRNSSTFGPKGSTDVIYHLHYAGVMWHLSSE